MTTPATAAAVPADMPPVDGVEHRFADIGGLRVHYAEAGSGDPLVLLHGWPQHWWAWRHLIEPLAERYRVICPDIRGLGWSEAPPGGYSWRELAADLVGLLDVLGIERARLVGHDWGCVVGYRACLHWPDRFERFVPMGGVHAWTASGARPRVILRPWHIYLYALVGPSATWLGVPENSLRAWRHVGSFTPEEMQIYLGPLRRPGSARATFRFDRNVVTHEIPWFVRHHRALRLRVPTLHLNGQHDPLTRRVPHSYHRYADDMRLQIVPGAGHFLAEERPAAVLDRLLDFLP